MRLPIKLGSALAGALFLLGLPSLGLAQSTVLQGGPWVPGHVPVYVGQGSFQPIIADGGGAGGGGVGAGLSEIGLTVRGAGAPPFANGGLGPFGTNLCDYDAPITNATGYHFLCFSPNANGGALIAYGAGGTAAQLPLVFNVNGTNYPFPFTTSGILGPGTSVVNDLACWNNTAGSLLKDCGTQPLTGPGAAVTGHLATWANSSATNLADGGAVPTVTSGVGITVGSAPSYALNTVLRGYIAGLTLSNDVGTPSFTLDISSGYATDSLNAVSISLAAFSKSTLGSWVAGTGNNGMGASLTVAPSTWYHVCGIINSGLADIYFDTDVACSANSPIGTTARRRIGSFKTDASSHILAFSQSGDEFIWAATIADVNTTVGTTATLFSLSVPPGVKVNALFRLQGTPPGGSGTDLLLSPPDQNVEAWSTANATLNTAAGSAGSMVMNLRTNASAQIRAVAGNAGTGIVIATYGYIDPRGRFN